LQIEQLKDTVRSLRAEIERIKNDKSDESTQEVTITNTSAQPCVDNASTAFVERIVEPELGANERAETIRAKPGIFVQARYSALPIRDADSEFEPNFSLTRIETRWAGRVANRLGAGVEIQFHPAIDGSPEELVNDAFLEYYLNDHTTVRVGQFIKPFGFDIQQSSSVRESPERAIFAGYFFPGQRDRGVLLFGDLRFLDVAALRGVEYFLGAFNGNRFFTDNNRQSNYLARLRKVFTRQRLAIGLSAQAGKQLLPPGTSGNNNENLFGFDLQYAVTDRLGLRGEFVTGNTPSTLLSIEPEFAPAFRPGTRSSGGHIFINYRLTSHDNIYARCDQFNNDPVTGRNVRAFNFGFFRPIGELSRLSFDYQFKNRPSFNDDAVNGRLNLTWSIEF
ncbi:MAG: OprO/OprP family phosphate-selective porin, partial [Acidobacteria bacterium]|nr:OprO/OprP family phosphate-selective porin [Acidobacteriota bacterium]